MSRNPLNSTAFDQLDTLGLAPDTHRVALACALLWAGRSATDVQRLLVVSGLRTRNGHAFSLADVRKAWLQLAERDLLFEDRSRHGVFQLVDTLRAALYRQWLDTATGSALVDLVCRADRFHLSQSSHHWNTGNMATTVAYVRAKYFSGAPTTELQSIRNLVSRSFNWESIVLQAILPGFDGPSFARIDGPERWSIAYQATVSVCLNYTEGYLPIVDWACAELARDATVVPENLRLVLADLALLRADADLLQAALLGIDNGWVAGIRAAQRVLAGEWAGGQAAFEASLKQRRSEIGGSKHFLSASIAWFYPLSLLAQATTRHLDLARKFCATESGRRQPDAESGWGRWVHVIDVRLGRAALIGSAVLPLQTSRDTVFGAPLDALWGILLAAWLSRETITGFGAADPQRAWRDPIALLRDKLRACRMQALLRQLDDAAAVLEGHDPPAGSFIAGSSERWHEVLVTLQSLGGQGGEAAAGAATRLLWEVDIGKRGQLAGIRPLEQKRGQRGWNRPRAISLARLVDNQQLSAADAKVARAIRLEPGYGNRMYLDLAAAIVALVGHPTVFLASAPEQFVDLTESPPELELIRDGDRYRMRIDPPLRLQTDIDIDAYYLDSEQIRVAEALRLITLIPDGPQRLRLVRFSAEQQQAARLVGGHFAIPANAPGVQDEVEKTLRALAARFQVHADAAQATRQVASDSRLRAELAPVDADLSLRLVVTPLGSDGPRLTPGSGRRQLMAVIGSETVGTERDLAGERRHLEAILDALPFLDGSERSCEWLIDDAENALAAVEKLPTLPELAAVEWPKGKSVRVVSLGPRQLGMRVTRERDWFRLDGEAKVDEGLVLQLSTLLGAARDRSRFVPMGDGIYAALTRSLKQKLADLAAVLEPDRDGGKAPLVAAAWLDEILDGTELDAGADFRQAIDRLRSAQEIVPQPPKLLQASLRPYQEDGYQWAMRLATAGMGGCLADDMGLGKTLQALAVLLERAAGGPALVIAPTSVCGNWLAECQRFAPTLNARIYGEAGEDERESLLGDAGPQDLLIVSYTLLQLAQERFAGRNWHTLIADEAQAVKNAAAKRSQALFELSADFRLALTGTPVENRLADLWSIMRFANPGLLGTSNRFNERFAGPIERNRDREAQHVLKRLVGPFVLRRTKSEVLQDLPSRTELILSVAPEAAEAAHYEALRREAAREIDATLEDAPAAQARFNVLAQLTRLRRAACDPRLCSPQFGIAGAKVQAFADLAGELIANGHKALVFSQFVDFLQILREPLDAAGFSYQYLDGATPAAERSRRVAAFQAGEGDLFLISLKAGGFGLNLTAADYVVITDPWWNPAAEDQAMGRAHRIGQLRPVTVYRLVSRGTVEERIVDLHHEKRALAESILADGEASALPSTEDLVALIRGE
ncbi:MAG: ATP-dependent helicase HepA [Candidatus Accumulibacter adjunctus]|uniref:ATP-dependent helicase HepA n=1 Tax=Candidatus Accumulibacter adjunctus TaxID=1454001 RepID=A0A011MD38_9PROT|nr:MAG: ATP-dependent helicase HepA [Candidatus Accumulibacter adjunctus]